MRHSYIKPLFLFIFFLYLTPLSAFASYSPFPAIVNAPGEKVIVVSPRVHAWGAYDASGRLIRWGTASAGANWCRDLGRPCRTFPGSYRIYYAGDHRCVSARFPIPRGGAPMPYCMYFNGNQALHGSPNVVRGNISHGCVRLYVSDAKWLRYQFIDGLGTRVIILPY